MADQPPPSSSETPEVRPRRPAYDEPLPVPPAAPPRSERPRRPRRRILLLGVVVVAVLVALGVILTATGVVPALEARCQPANRVQPAFGNQQLVVVAEFSGAGGRDVSTALRRDIDGRPGPVVAQVCDAPASDQEARALGEELDASLVVWGTIESGVSTAQVEVLRQPGNPHEEADFTVPPRLPAAYTFELSNTIRRDAPFVGGFVAAYVAGQGFNMPGVQAELEGALDSQHNATSPADQARMDANAAQARFALGTLRLVLTDDPDETLDDFDWALRLDERYADAYYNRGLARYLMGDGAAAVDDFSQAVGLDASDASALSARGAAYLLADDPAAALADFDQAIALDGELARAYHLRGKVRAAQDDPAAALEDFTRAIELDRRYVPAYKDRGEIYLSLDDPQSAIADYQLALVYFPEYQEAHVLRGLAYYAAGDYHAAIDDFNQSLQANPDDPQTIYYRGRASFFTGDYLRAISDFTIVLADQPENAEVFLYRANAYFGRRNYAAAEADFDMALQLEPDNAEAFYIRAQARRWLKDFPGAVDDYTRAIEGGYDEADIYLDRADVTFFELGQPQAALSDYARALEHDPSLEAARRGTAMALYEVGQYGESVAAWRALLDINAFEGEHHAGLAVALAADDEPEAALAAYLRAAELDREVLDLLALRDKWRWSDDARLVAADLIAQVSARLSEQARAAAQQTQENTGSEATPAP